MKCKDCQNSKIIISDKGIRYGVCILSVKQAVACKNGVKDSYVSIKPIMEKIEHDLLYGNDK